jgi:cytochrome P450 family 9
LICPDFSDTFLTAQAVGFFLDGFETSSKALSFALHELAVNPDVQEKLREELKANFDDNDGKIDYDVVRNCELLDNILHGKNIT